MYDVDAYAVYLSVMQWSVVHVSVWLLIMFYSSILNFKDHNPNILRWIHTTFCYSTSVQH